MIHGVRSRGQCDGKKYLRVCYYTNWSQYRPTDGKFFPEEIDATLCTHIIYAFGTLQNNQVTNFEWNDVDLYRRVMGLKQQNEDLKVLLAMGGWNAGSKVYSDMASTVVTRKTFIDSAIPWLRQHGFDGLDMDWEYPARRDSERPEDKENFVALLKEAYSAFRDENPSNPLMLTAAVAAGRGNIDGVYNVSEISRYLDFIAIMTYDFHGGSWEDQTGHNSPLVAHPTQNDQTFSMAWAAEYWVELGAPRDKLLIGLPTYGRTFNLLDSTNNGIGAPSKGGGAAGTYTREQGFLAYYEICEMQQNGGETRWDDVSKVPYYINGNLWVGFDNKQSIYYKIKDVVLQEGKEFGGIMIWSLPLDDFAGKKCCQGNYPLITYMNTLLTHAETGQSLPEPPETEICSGAGGSNSGGESGGESGGDSGSSGGESGSSGGESGGNGSETGGSGGSDSSTGGESDEFCAGKANGLYPYPQDCKMYYSCWNGQGVLDACRFDLYFNFNTQGCDYPSNVDCLNSSA